MVRNDGVEGGSPKVVVDSPENLRAAGPGIFRTSRQEEGKSPGRKQKKKSPGVLAGPV